MSEKNEFEEISHEQLDALIERVEHAIQHELALSVEDMKLLLLAINTLAKLQQQLESDEVTIFKLKKLVGLVKQTEQSRSLLGEKKKRLKAKKPKLPRDKNRKNTSAPKVVHHSLAEFNKGNLCPHCQRGKLYKFEPGRLLRVSGHAPYEATQHISERLLECMS